ncbi:hypothetical protein Tco_0898392 [Tanacetum coccineum]
MGDDVDISTLTIEQYLALIQDNNRPGIVKPEIGNDVEFEINSNFMIRRKLFAGNDDEDSHEHVRRIRKSIENTDSNIRALRTTTKNLQEKAYQLTQTVLIDTGEKVKARMTMGKESVKEPVPRDLLVFQTYALPTPFVGHLKGQIGSPYRTRKTICMIENPGEVHKIKAHEVERDMDVGWDIIVKDEERLSQFLTPTIHTLPNLEPVVQLYMPLGPVHDKEKIVRKEEQDYDIHLHDGVMQPLTPHTVHITPPDDDYVARATSPTLDKQLNEFEEEFSDITRVADKANGNPVKAVQ